MPIADCRLPIANCHRWDDSVVLSARNQEARAFADIVAGQMPAGILPLSSRKKLLALAAMRRIAPFEANLIIAAVQHQLGVGTAFSPALGTPAFGSEAQARRGEGRAEGLWVNSPRRWSLAATLAVALSAEAIIVGTIVLLFA